MPLPNFLIIGAAKCGTTSLAEYLQQHPDVFFCPEKEPNYFALAGKEIPDGGPASADVLAKLVYTGTVTDFAAYQALFSGVRGQKAVGEASVRNLYYSEASHRIKQTIPEAKLIAILREPVSRLYSHYCMNVQYQLEPLNLSEAIAAEASRIDAGWGWDWHYVKMGMYAQQLRHYYALFPKQQIKVFLYQDLVQRPLWVVQQIFRHIGVDDSFEPDLSFRGKPAYRPKYLLLDRWLNWPRSVRPGFERWVPNPLSKPWIAKLKQWNSIPIPKLDLEMRTELSKVFREDVSHLEDLIEQKTSWYD